MDWRIFTRNENFRRFANDWSSGAAVVRGVLVRPLAGCQRPDGPSHRPAPTPVIGTRPGVFRARDRARSRCLVIRAAGRKGWTGSVDGTPAWRRRVSIRPARPALPFDRQHRVRAAHSRFARSNLGRDPRWLRTRYRIHRQRHQGRVLARCGGCHAPHRRRVSDGASYALALGRINGDLFSRVVAFSPGFVPPGRATGKPEIFITHGSDDRILPYESTSGRIAPALKRAGYLVTLRTFAGGHTVPAELAREAFRWAISTANTTR